MNHSPRPVLHALIVSDSAEGALFGQLLTSSGHEVQGIYRPPEVETSMLEGVELLVLALKQPSLKEVATFLAPHYRGPLVMHLNLALSIESLDAFRAGGAVCLAAATLLPLASLPCDATFTKQPNPFISPDQTSALPWIVTANTPAEEDIARVFFEDLHLPMLLVPDRTREPLASAVHTLFEQGIPPFQTLAHLLSTRTDTKAQGAKIVQVLLQHSLRNLT